MGEPTDLNNPDVYRYIEQVLKADAEAVNHQQTLLVNWLFAVNAGGIGGLLTYFAAKNTRPVLIVGIFAFFIGLFFILLYGIRMFYWLLEQYRHSQKNVEQLHADKDLESFASRLNVRSDYNHLAELFAWISGGAAILGGLASAVGIIFDV